MPLVMDIPNWKHNLTTLPELKQSHRTEKKSALCVMSLEGLLLWEEPYALKNEKGKEIN